MWASSRSWNLDVQYDYAGKLVDTDSALKGGLRPLVEDFATLAIRAKDCGALASKLYLAGLFPILILQRTVDAFLEAMT